MARLVRRAYVVKMLRSLHHHLIMGDEDMDRVAVLLVAGECGYGEMSSVEHSIVGQVICDDTYLVPTLCHHVSCA